MPTSLSPSFEYPFSLKDNNQIKRRNLPTLETGLRGLKTVVRTVMYCGSSRVQRQLTFEQFHHLPRHKTQVRQ